MRHIVTLAYDGGSRTLGILEDDTLTCTRTVAKHLFRFGRATVQEARNDGVSAWGLDCKACDGLIARGAKFLRIVTDEGAYVCKLQDMADRGKVLNLKPHRNQYFLNEKAFTIGEKLKRCLTCGEFFYKHNGECCPVCMSGDWEEVPVVSKYRGGEQ